jgi:hypothetical protein
MEITKNPVLKKHTKLFVSTLTKTSGGRISSHCIWPSWNTKGFSTFWADTRIQIGADWRLQIKQLSTTRKSLCC